MNTPKSLQDLRYELNKLHLQAGIAVETAANRWFHELFQNNDPVFVRRLFVEDGKTVYESFQDSGSEEYLYLIK